VVLAPEEDQGRGVGEDPEVQDPAEDEHVVARRVGGLDGAVEPGGGSGEDRGAGVGGGLPLGLAEAIVVGAANRRATGSWSAPRMLTAKDPAARIAGHEREASAGRNPTSGGSSETDVNDPMDRPTGPAGVSALTTVTPVGK
jgi:hypothetical protein